MASRPITGIISSSVIAATAGLLSGCERSTPPPQNRVEVTEPDRTSASTTSKQNGKSPLVPIQQSPTPAASPQISPSPDVSEAHNQLLVALAQYPLVDEKARIDIAEHLAELADQGVDKNAIERTLGSMFGMESSADIKISILAELYALGPPYVVDHAIAAVSSNQPLEVRDEGISILEELGDKRAISVLQPLLADPDEVIREEAQEAIDFLNDRPAP